MGLFGKVLQLVGCKGKDTRFFEIRIIYWTALSIFNSIVVIASSLILVGVSIFVGLLLSSELSKADLGSSSDRFS